MHAMLESAAPAPSHTPRSWLSHETRRNSTSKIVSDLDLDTTDQILYLFYIETKITFKANRGTKIKLFILGLPDDHVPF